MQVFHAVKKELFIIEEKNFYKGELEAKLTHKVYSQESVDMVLEMNAGNWTTLVNNGQTVVQQSESGLAVTTFEITKRKETTAEWSARTGNTLA